RYYKRTGESPPHARMTIRFQNHYELAYLCRRMLGRVRLADDFDDFIRSQDLGPDALNDGLNADAFVSLLNERRGCVKSLLMNQCAVAGIGNVYSDEILFQSRMHPETRCEALDESRSRALHRNLRRVLSTAIERDAEPSEFPDSWLLHALQEDGEQPRCPVCHGRIERIDVAGRRAHLCPDCQSHRE
ncbi:MAG: hypothetical protein VYC34_03470, partial [Planctomycetota bacterium]|nr:hypothetical protein [Planctomycetota bacterium]